VLQPRDMHKILILKDVVFDKHIMRLSNLLIKESKIWMNITFHLLWFIFYIVHGLFSLRRFIILKDQSSQWNFLWRQLNWCMIRLKFSKKLCIKLSLQIPWCGWCCECLWFLLGNIFVLWMLAIVCKLELPIEILKLRTFKIDLAMDK
jgi:hypothetical protein